MADTEYPVPPRRLRAVVAPRSDGWANARTWSERLGSLKVIALVAGGVFFGGAVSMSWVLRVATKEDVRRELARFSVEHEPEAEAVRKLTRDRDDDLRQREESRRKLEVLDERVDWIVRTLYPLATKAGTKPSSPPRKETP